MELVELRSKKERHCERGSLLQTHICLRSDVRERESIVKVQAWILQAILEWESVVEQERGGTVR